jgi:hypothetical protein
VRDLTVNAGLSLNGKRILLLGAGGAVRGALEPLLAERPSSLIIANRTVEKAELLAESFDDLGPVSASGFDWLREPVDVIINATSASLSGDLPPNPPPSATGPRSTVPPSRWTAWACWWSRPPKRSSCGGVCARHRRRCWLNCVDSWPDVRLSLRTGWGSDPPPPASSVPRPPAVWPDAMSGCAPTCAGAALPGAAFPPRNSR